MLSQIKVIDIELSQGITTIEGLENYGELQALVRLLGTPIGYVRVPVRDGKVIGQTLSQIILEQHNHQIISQLLHNGLATPTTKSAGWQFEDLLKISLPKYQGSFPLVTVAIYFNNRIADLTTTLHSLQHLDYPHFDILVIDNTADGKAEQLMVTQYPEIRYIRELCPGSLNTQKYAISENYAPA